MGISFKAKKSACELQRRPEALGQMDCSQTNARLQVNFKGFFIVVLENDLNRAPAALFYQMVKFEIAKIVGDRLAHLF